MPPKAKFTKEEVIAAALEIARERGIEFITARELGAKLSSSARPIFTLFQNMEEVLGEVKRAARNIYNGYIKEGLMEPLAFRGVGRAYIRFAGEEPQLFRLLFMGEHATSLRAILPEIDENYDSILRSVTDGYGISREEADSLYCHLWIYSHGIAVLLATRACALTAEEINDMLKEVCISLIMRIKQGERR